MDGQNGNPQPGLACLTGNHINVLVFDTARDAQQYDRAGLTPAMAQKIGIDLRIAASWCLWCGSGVSDPARIADDGTPMPGWGGPYYAIDHTPFTRDREDMPR